ncbi:hypothetical protein MNB_SV-13-1771 [hydrothermal vent metagenome]|uniref:Serine aminopeptidase S33 domain-containing protein n=1 Tax=hydrothermal vent metagenome TaxID=652676 RepID=A0A1W1CIY3_9ZZZZ
MSIIKNISILTLIGIILLYLIGVYLSRPTQVTIPNPLIDLPLQEVSFPSKSTAMLHGWYVQGDKDKGGVLLLHGLHSSRVQMLDRAKFLYKAGYSVLLLDFQGHGESIGERITFGHLESLDAEAGYLYLKKCVSPYNVAVIGVSLGGASVLLGEVKNLSSAMVLEAVYPSIEQAIENRLNIKLGKIGTYLLPILTLQLKIQLGISPKELQPIEHISSAKGALFIIGGDKDERTTIEETKALYDKAKQIKQLWIIKDAKHIDFEKYKPKVYQEKILRFFDTYLD